MSKSPENAAGSKPGPATRESPATRIHSPAGDRAATGRRPITIEDLWALRRVGAPAALPDGSGIVVPVTAFDMEKNEGRTRLWLHSLAGEAPRPLTAADATSAEPAVSPDGRHLAFARRAGKEKPQLYVMPLDGGEAECLTQMPLGISDPRWFPDGRRLAFIAPVVGSAPAIEDTRAQLDARDKDPVKARVTEDRIYRYWDHWLTGGEVHHIFVIDLETREVKDLIPESKRWFDLMDPAGSFDIAPDGTEVAFSANSSEPPYQTVNYDVYVAPVAGGAVRNLTADNVADDMRPRYTPDGRSIIYGMQREADFYADRVRLVRHDRETGENLVLTESWDRSANNWEIGPDGRTIAFTAEDRGRVHLFTLDLEAASAAAAAGMPVEPERRVRGGNVGRPAWVGSDQLAFTIDSLGGPPEVWVSEPAGAGLARVTHENDERLAGIELGEVREIEFEGFGGARVQMFVLNPPGFDPARKWPLVHLVHGGPHGIFGDQFHFRWNAQLFAAPGYVVGMVNFHGSTSFGQDFAASILGAHGERPFADVMAATDRLLAEGYIDEQRMAAAGGSYGGYLVSWIAGHTDRFACLVNHAGVYDTLSQYGSDVTLGRSRAYGGEPWDGLEVIDLWNPARFASGFHSPMLIIHGENDYRVPHTQALAVYGVYKAKGVPARLVVYPDENHWILKPRNSRHWYGEVLGWLARFLDRGRKGRPAGPE